MDNRHKVKLSVELRRFADLLERSIGKLKTENEVGDIKAEPVDKQVDEDEIKKTTKEVRNLIDELYVELFGEGPDDESESESKPMDQASLMETPKGTKVYCLECGECGSKYIGITSSSLKVCKSAIRSYINNDRELILHYRMVGHQIDKSTIVELEREKDETAREAKRRHVKEHAKKVGQKERNEQPLLNYHK
ncbi:hypothetical protein SNE40_010813 [Patella caerulea]|uniref:Uncharacterized protein n=1 Tax=Patella caerulea TaxID=87958 RepID=A0AAN8JUT8_PATCE